MKRRCVMLLAVVRSAFVGCASPRPLRRDTLRRCPNAGPLWIDFADGSVPFWQVVRAAGRDRGRGELLYPPQLRAMGTKTIYWDMNFRLRVGTPLAPFDPAS